MTFVPLGRHVIVEANPLPGMSGSIVIPDTAQQPPVTGQILALGPFVAPETGLCVGDTVLLPPMGGRRLHDNNNPRAIYLLFDDTDLEVKVC